MTGDEKMDWLAKSEALNLHIGLEPVVGLSFDIRLSGFQQWTTL